VYQDSANFVQETEDCGYIIAANTGGSFNDEGDAWLSGPSVADVNKTFVGPGQDLASCVQETADGGYIIAGYIEPGGTAWLIKTDSDGNELWKKTFNGPRASAFFVQEIEDGGYIIAGSIASSSTSNLDVWLIRTDSDGNELWSKTFGGSNHEFARCVQETEDGGYIIAASGEASLIRTDSDGNELWSKIFPGDLASVQETEDGGYIAAGETGLGTSAIAAWLIRTDADGNGRISP
jgi:hypothetical protein